MSSSYTIQLNSSNVIKNNKYYNSLEYKFLNSSFTIKKGMKIYLSFAQVPYSFYNISSAYNNNTFTINFPQGSGYTTVNVIIKDGFYDLTSLTNYINYTLVNNNLYLIDNNGVKQTFINFQLNTTYYAAELDLSVIPTTLPTGWTKPSSFVMPLAAKTPEILLNSNDFYKFIGFEPNTKYPSITPQTSEYMKLSTTTPKAAQVNSISVRCSLVNNYIGSPTDLLTSFPVISQSGFGSNINFEPKIKNALPLKQGTYNSMIVTLNDQDFNELPNLDPNILLSLVIVDESYKM
jgi:hypothetical protein